MRNKSEDVFGRFAPRHGVSLAAVLILTAPFACKSNTISSTNACPPGFVDCNHDSSDGCEVNTSVDTKNCGECGTVCSDLNGTPVCQNAQCSIQCDTGYASCSAAVAGCPAHIASDPTNCGACGHACATENAQETCAGGACTVATCTGSYADCNQSPSDGCETNTASDADNCGMCGVHCTAAGQTCQSGSCTCPVGEKVCGSACVDEQSDPSNCGACGNSCTVANAGSSCSQGACAHTCNSGFHVCSGACVDDTSPQSCGSSCTPCTTTVVNANPACSSASCSLTCNSGFSLCGTSSCVDFANDPSNCGGCNVGCGTGATCSGRICQVQTMASGVYKPGTISVGDNDLFVMEGDGNIYEMPKGGGTLSLLVSSTDAGGTIEQFQASGSRLFWSLGDGNVHSVNDDGSSPAAPVSSIWAWTIGAGKLYWLTADTVTGTCTPLGAGTPTPCTPLESCPTGCVIGTPNGTIMTANLDGTNPQQVAGSLATYSFDFVQWPFHVPGLLANASAVYAWYETRYPGTSCGFAGFGLYAYPLASGSALSLGPILDSTAAGPMVLGIDAQYVYVNQLYSGCKGGYEVPERELLTSGALTEVGSLFGFDGFAAGNALDYVIDVHGQLESFDPTASTVSATAVYGSASGVATDAAFVYFTDGSNGKVLRVAQQ